MKAAVVIILVLLVAVGAVFAWRAQAARQALAAQAPKETLYLAIPQGLFVPLSKVMDKFEKTHPNLEFMTMVDTPEAMAQAVEENDEKPDIFISPGGHELEVLRHKGFIIPETVVAFGSYELAILVPKDNPGKVAKLEDLLHPQVKVISLSDPDLNAACYAARQSLQNLGLWKKLQPKLKVTGCCMSSFRWILDGRAQANVQFLGCPIDPKTNDMAQGAKVKIACTFPRHTYYAPRNVAGILKSTTKRPLAQQFLTFMTSPDMISFMAKNRMRNDQNLPLTPGPWGPKQEANPMPAKAGSP